MTIAVNVAIKAEHRVLDLSSMEAILREADPISLEDCDCRTRRGNCEAPLDVCIGIDDAAEYQIEREKRNVRKVTLEEALDALRRSHEAGLVHMAYTLEGDDHPKVICSSCSGCCHTLSGLLRFGIAPIVLTSDKVAEDNKGLCSGCGVCADRCHFGAREMVDGSLVYNPEQCFGCGLCWHLSHRCNHAREKSLNHLIVRNRAHCLGIHVFSFKLSFKNFPTYQSQCLVFFQRLSIGQLCIL